MPVLWRYLLRSYFQVFALCVSGFIAILLVTRFQDIALFATSGAKKFDVLLFALYQIPYVLPIAIPFSCLIAAILLFQRLSHTHELTALRTCGLGLSPIAYPLILAGALMAIVNFTISSELSPYCRTLSKELIYKMTAMNPLFVLQKETLIKLKNAYADMKMLYAGKQAKDVILVLRNQSNDRLSLMIGKEISIDGEILSGKQVSFISSVDTKKTQGFDHLILENQDSMKTKAANMAQFIQDANWNTTHDYLPLRMILAKNLVEKKKGHRIIGRGELEIARRISLALAAFTFTVIGTAFGMEIGRYHRKRGILFATLLAAIFMLCFICAKSMKHSPAIAFWIYLTPHPVLLLLSLKSLKRISAGCE